MDTLAASAEPTTADVGRRTTRTPILVDDLVRCGHRDRPALTFKDTTISYGELDTRVSSAAAGLRRLGIRRGQRVVVYLDKRIETVVVLLATAAVGGVLVPVNPLLKAHQVGRLVADCTASAVITTRVRYRAARDAFADAKSLEHVVLVGSQNGRPRTGAAPDAPGDHRSVCSWERLVDAPVDPSQPTRTIDADLAAILYTSGSTGGPKGVVLSHRNLLAGAESVASYLGHTPDDVILAMLPLSFDAGLSQLTTALIAGAHLVLTNFLLPRDVIRLCARHRVTGLTGVPPLWLRLAGQDWPEPATRNVRYFANTGGRMPRPTLDRLRQTFPHARPFLMYGLTEAFRATQLDPAEVDRRPDSIGRAIPNAEVLVVRPDGSLCEPGEEGEIVQRGALVAQGYWNDPMRTAERFRPVPGGVNANTGRTEIAVWSGDTAYRDADGFLYFVGRTDELIKTSGYRVSPTEVEEAAYATGLVTEAVALGMPDERLGQHIVLIVAGGTDAAALRRAMAETTPGFMLPQRVVFHESLPRSPNGKFDRVALRRLVTR